MGDQNKKVIEGRRGRKVVSGVAGGKLPEGDVSGGQGGGGWRDAGGRTAVDKREAGCWREGG